MKTIGSKNAVPAEFRRKLFYYALIGVPAAVLLVL